MRGEPGCYVTALSSGPAGRVVDNSRYCTLDADFTSAADTQLGVNLITDLAASP
jgi:hypothetical protein